MKILRRLRIWLRYRREKRKEKSDVKMFVGDTEIPIHHCWIHGGSLHAKGFITSRLSGLPTLEIGDGLRRGGDYRPYSFEPGDILRMHVRIEPPRPEGDTR